jgi:hypothetical protein
MEKKSALRARRSELRAAEGTSIMVPMGISSLKGISSALRFLFDFCHHTEGDLQFIDTRNHRKHDSQLTIDAGPEESPELTFEHISIIQDSSGWPAIPR